MQAGCIAAVGAGVFLRRSRPLTGLALVISVQVVILAASLGTTLGVPIALVPAISLLAYASGRRETQLRHFVIMAGCEVAALLALGLLLQPDEPVGESVLSW